MELAPGVHRIGGEEPVVWNALCYLVRGEPNVLIDCGSVEGLPALHRNLAALELAITDIGLVVGTHGHRDHVQGAIAIPAPLLLHPAGVEAVTTGDLDRTAAYLFGRGFVPLDRGQVRAIEDGTMIDLGAGGTLEVIATPGHSPDSACVLLRRPGEKTVLFGGDTTWGGYGERIGSDLGEWRRSLERLLGREFEWLLPGHCPVEVLPQGRGSLERAVEGFGREMRPSFGGLESPWG